MKKKFAVVKKILSAVFVTISVAMMIFTIVSVLTVNRNDRDIFGYKAFIVLSDSMKATDFAAGDIVVVKRVNPESLVEGDIIAFSSQNVDSYGETVTHKIRSKTVDANGEAGFITYGTTTGTDDETIVTYPYICGLYVFHIPKLGKFFNFLRTVPGYIACILTPFLMLIILQALNTVELFRKYKKEQVEQLEAERKQIDEDRKQNEAMMTELMKLREMMERQGVVPQAGGQTPMQYAAEQIPPPTDLYAQGIQSPQPAPMQYTAQTVQTAPSTRPQTASGYTAEIQKPTYGNTSERQFAPIQYAGARTPSYTAGRQSPPPPPTQNAAQTRPVTQSQNAAPTQNAVQPRPPVPAQNAGQTPLERYRRSTEYRQIPVTRQSDGSQSDFASDFFYRQDE